MKTYDLYMHSGPQMKTTYFSVPELTGCIAVRPTTDAALEAAPDVIRSFLGFMQRHGQRVKPDAKFSVNVAEHDRSGGFLGGKYVAPDNEPLTRHEIAALMHRLDALHHEIRRIVEPLSPKQLDAEPARGRSIRRILSHVCAEGGYLRGVKGASRLQREVDEGKANALDALDELHAMELARLAEMSDDELGAVIMRGQSPWSVRSALRRMLEHAWEHYVEIAERIGVAP
jgi:predicted RNase H-like HicB family nuclease